MSKIVPETSPGISKGYPSTLREHFSVLLVDDDPDFVAGLEGCFRLESDFHLDVAYNAEDAINIMKKNTYDILLLDVLLPDKDGRELCRSFRKIDDRIPIIMLTVLDSDADTILGLEAGADDYLDKPFSFNVLRARLRSHLRQKKTRTTSYSIGKSVFNARTRSLERKDKTESTILTMKESDLLALLCEARPDSVSRDDIMHTVWDHKGYLETHTLETHIHRLRHKLKQFNDEKKTIVTKSGGYSLLD